MKGEIAIVVVGYNRKQSIERLLFSLNQADYENEKITLIISIDKSNTNIVEEYADQFNWIHGEKIVDCHTCNLGLKAHMLSLGKWFEDYDALVILEDDIVVSSQFFNYAKACVYKYKDNPQIAGISLYSFSVNYQTGLPFIPMHNGQDVYFMNCAMSWGEVWMKEQWRDFYKWYQKNNDFSPSSEIPFCLFKWSKNSWLKFHTRYCIETNKYFVFPYISYSTNYGDNGVHHSGYGYDTAQVVIEYGKRPLVLPKIENDNCVLYDGFFENKAIPKWLGLNAKDVLIDLNGSHIFLTGKQFLLSSKVYNFRILKTFGLEYKPIEANILTSVAGFNLFLYDTTVKENNKLTFNNNKYYSYYYCLSSLPVFFRRVGLINIVSEFVDYLTTSIKNKLR